MFRQSITLRLMMPLIVAMLLLVLLAGITLTVQRGVADANRKAAAAQQLVVDVGELRSISRSLQRDALNLVTERDLQERATIAGKFAKRRAEMADRLIALERIAGRAGLPQRYFTGQRNVVTELGRVAAQAGQGDSTGALAEFRRAVRPAERAASHIADAEIERMDAAARTTRASADAAAQAARLTQLIATALVALAALVAGVLITRRGVVRPLHDLREAMGLLAEGRSDGTIPHTGRADEIGQMAQSMVRFRDQLAAAEAAKAEQTALILDSLGTALAALARGDLVARIDRDLSGPFAPLRADYNAAADALGAALAQVAEGARTIDGGAADLRQASDDLSQRTERQAASLEETAAAMEQVTTGVQSTAERARRADAAVHAARGEAERSGEVVTQAIEAMGGIERMAQEIGTIIAVIDGIAFQTNLLALNAGVEAARAGDAGRGFAVVAAEVRALAQRSAEAAQDVKARVAASSTRVGEGVRLVGDTGRSLARTIERIAEIEALVAAIAAATAEQATALHQINAAVAEMDGLTQHNAAMVDQATATSRALAADADTLGQQVARFRLAGAPPAMPTPLRPHRRRAGGRTALAVVPQDDWDGF